MALMSLAQTLKAPYRGANGRAPRTGREGARTAGRAADLGSHHMIIGPLNERLKTSPTFRGART